jgi:hypothetical protein
MATFIERVLGAARLESTTYEEVERDPAATNQAALVVALSGVAGGIAALDEAGVSGLVFGTFGSLLGWCVWAALTYLIGTRFLPGPRTQADLGQLLRTIGFASAPGLLNVLGLAPGVGPLVSLVVALWMLAAMVVAVRAALDYESNGRAIAVCVLGFIAYLLALILIGGLLGGLLALAVTG